MIARYRLAIVVAIPLILTGVALAHAHKAGGHHGSNDAHHIEMHLDHMSQLLTRIGASEAQKKQMDVILRGAFTSLKAAKDQHQAAFGQFHELLLSSSIDRGRIESLRAEQIRSLDELSKNFALAFADAAEVLSPDQRAALAQEIRTHHGG
jgi:Spy/CpxP family protein refolding chaperone